MRVKKIFLIFIIVFMFFTLFLFNYTVNATMTVDELKARYPTKSRWTDEYWGMRKNGTRVKATECAGFAALMYNQFYGIDPYYYAKTEYDVNQIQSGDIVRYKNDGHSVWVENREGNNVWIAECNYDYNCSVRWRQTTMSEFYDGFTYIYKAPYVLTEPEPALNAPSNLNVNLTNTGVNVSWSNSNSFLTGYEIKIFKKSDVDNKNFSNPIYSSTITNIEITKQNITIDQEGTFYVYVYSLRGNKVSEGARNSFYIKPIQTIELSTDDNRTNMIVGETRKYTAKIIPEDTTAVNKNIVWKSSNPDVISVDSNGLVTALKEGYASITVGVGNVAYKSVDFVVTYTEVPIRGIVINGPKTIYQYQDVQFSVQFMPENATGDKTVKWKSTNPQVATVNSNGIVTGVSTGSTIIQATAVNGILSSLPVTVKEGIMPTSVTLNKTNMELISGKTEKLVATVLPSNATNKNVTWSSSNENVVTVDQKGNITAKEEGTAIITVKTSNGIKATCTVKVPKPVDCLLNYYEYTFTSLDQNLKLIANLDNGESTTFTYKSSNTNVLKVDSNGVVTPLKPGFADISVTNKKYNKVVYCQFYVQTLITLSDGSKAYLGDMNRDGFFNSTDSAMILDAFSHNPTSDEALIGDLNGDGIVNSTDAAIVLDLFKNANFFPGRYYKITGVKLNKNELSLGIGNTQSLKATIEPQNTTDNPTITWTSSNQNVATVDSSGKITAKKAGSATITAKTSNGKTATCKVTVTESLPTKIPITSIQLNKTSVTLEKGKTTTITATINPSNTTESKTVTWTSSDQNVATVDSSGKITAKKAGSATITAKTSNGKTATCKVTVTESLPTKIPITSIKLNKTSVTLEKGKTTTITVTINPSNTTESKTITWTSSNQNVATVDSSGKITAKKAGSTTITAKTTNGKTATCKVTVTESLPTKIPITSIKLNKTSVTLEKGKTITITATINPSNTTESKTITWTSSNQNVATVDSSGKITAKKAGSATITAKTSNGKTATCKVTVTDQNSNTNTSKNSNTSTNKNTISSTTTKIPNVSYRTHVENIGWQNYVKNGATAGTSGRSLRLEGINIKLENNSLSGNIEYCTHVQNIGWQNYVKNGAMSGTSGKALRLEAIKIRLTGDLAKQYDIYYRVHCQNFGWMGWAKNGAEAGSAGYGYRLEAIQIKLVKKNEKAPGSTANSYKQNLITYQTHVQYIGWQGLVNSGEMSGTTGQSLRLEGIKINLNNLGISGNIEYCTHVQNIGWQNYVKNGAMSGTSGRALRLEAIKIRLTGDLAKKYDIYYRVHCQNFGWMGWAKNGASSGSAGFGYRLEGIEIVLVEKGGSAPGSTANSFIQK